MKAPVFNQLVENIRRDGCLTSLPLIYQDEVLSGNHRVQAAIKAGVFEEDCIEVLGQLTEGERLDMLGKERQLSLQLSHNALSGEDDPNLLAQLYDSLPLEERLYSGITDDQIRPPEPLDIASLSAGSMAAQEIQLVFLPEDAQAFTEFVESIGKKAGRSAKTTTLVASLEDYNRFFDAVVAVKNYTNIRNTGLAVRAMAELAMVQLEELKETDAEPAGTEAERPS